jgi:phosphate transport system substrate-binding protein
MKWKHLTSLAICSLMISSCSRPTEKRQNADAAGIILQGTSSSSIAIAYWQWFSQLAVNNNINGDLQVMGSGESMRRFLSGAIDFAGTDTAPTSNQFQTAKRGMLAFPVTARAIAIAYNYPGCKLQLTRQQLADIFLGKIRDFVELGCERKPIQVLHRESPSGTTATFTATLSAFSESWRHGPGAGLKVNWPTGKPVADSEAMIQTLSNTPGSLGYVEAAYVGKPLSTAALASRSGVFLQPTSRETARALSTIQLDERLLGQNPDPKTGYPIVSLAWVLIPRQPEQTKGEALRISVSYMLSQSGQDDAERLGYAPLPEVILTRSKQQLNQIQH